MNPDASEILIRTRATGMLARLAHDLQLRARFQGSVDSDDGPWRAELTFASRDVRVDGVMKKGTVDRGVLSSSDIANIEQQICRDVLPEIVRVTAQGHDFERAEVDVHARRTQRVRVTLRQASRDGVDGFEAVAKLSLSRLGIKEIKGPLGAFKVADPVEIRAFIAR